MFHTHCNLVITLMIGVKRKERYNEIGLPLVSYSTNAPVDHVTYKISAIYFIFACCIRHITSVVQHPKSHYTTFWLSFRFTENLSAAKSVLLSAVCREISKDTWNFARINDAKRCVFLAWSYDDCLEDKRQDHQNCSVLYCVVHNHMHTDMSSSYR